MQALIEQIGEEVTWEVMCTEGRWYVTASHTGDDENPENNFKFNAAAPSLALAVALVAAQCVAEGPGWIDDEGR